MYAQRLRTDHRMGYSLPTADWEIRLAPENCQHFSQTVIHYFVRCYLLTEVVSYQTINI